MKTVLYLIIAAFLLLGCGKESITEVDITPKEVAITLDYDFFESGSMVRTGDDLYQEFYNKYIKTRRLTPRLYEISFKNKERGDSIVVKGDWRNIDFITLIEGEYEVQGISYPVTSRIPMEPSYISQDTLSLVFNEKIRVSKDIDHIKLTAKYDCFMLIFDNANFKNIRFGAFSPKTEAHKLDDMYYMLFRDIDLINELSSVFKAPLLCKRNNGEVTELWINKFDFKKGRYYYFKDIDGSFEIPPMDNGNVTK